MLIWFKSTQYEQLLKLFIGRKDLTFFLSILKIEENLSRKKVMMSETSMAWGHSTNMAPLEMSRIQSDKALLVVNAARRLQDKYLRVSNLKDFFF